MLRPLGILVTEIGIKGGDTSASMATKIKYSINRWYQKLWNGVVILNLSKGIL